jgi:HSP20 family protein
MDYLPWDRSSPTDLWDAFDSLRGEMERSLGLFRSPGASGLLDRTASPAIDVLETGDEFIVTADLPGVSKDNLELSVTGTLLAIKGSKQVEHEEEKRKFLRKETWVGGFGRTIELPANVDPDKVSAELKDGILTVRIAKREEAKTKAIAVSVK